MIEQTDEERFFETIAKHGVSADYPLFEGYIPNAIESMADKIQELEDLLLASQLEVNGIKIMALSYYGKQIDPASVVLDLGKIAGKCELVEEMIIKERYGWSESGEEK